MGERNLDDPERVSASWLWHQVPMKLWLILGGIILGAFSFGVTVGQTTFVRELVGINVTTVSREVASQIQSQIEELTDAHIRMVTRLEAEIKDYEKKAAESTISYIRERSSKAAEKLRADLREANGNYRRNIEKLKSLLD